MSMMKFLAGFGLGVLVGLLAAAAFLLKTRTLASQVHRVSVSYPSRWDAGEFRNCRLGRPHYSGDRWPEFECDGVGKVDLVCVASLDVLFDFFYALAVLIFGDG